jgi:RNA polymerase sigma-70 factor (ECF subfamily)
VGDSGTVEDELGQLLAAKAYDRVAARALEAYGDEVYGFLVSYVGGESDAAEVFGQMGEDLWKGLPKFEALCTVRTWLYVLARHAAARFRRTPWNKGERHTGDARIDDMLARERTRTRPWQRTDIKDKFAQLREALDPDDRMLLTLRIDRGMSWADVARVTLNEEAPDDRTLKRETDRLAKRFQLLKEELRRKAKDVGIIGEDP